MIIRFIIIIDRSSKSLGLELPSRFSFLIWETQSIVDFSFPSVCIEKYRQSIETVN